MFFRRCKNMHEMVTNYQQELSFVNKQLLSAVEQKIKLQEQNEAWQVHHIDYTTKYRSLGVLKINIVLCGPSNT